MPQVIGVRFKSAGKNYYFDPGNLELSCGDNVIVETARGLEFGTVRGCIQDLPEEELVAPLKKIVRKATEEDKRRNERNLAKKEKAMQQCQEKIDHHKLDMKLIDLEYTFDNNKVIFYFTADGRVDFRELVKDLAAVFKMRIELRQIGVRDEAKMLGGIGSCGKELCCSTWLPDFEPVSIKMAKVQNLSLNPTKISGSCGRLMCCLKYENENYQQLKKGMPMQGERIKTDDGIAVVIDSNILTNNIKARLVLEEKSDDAPEKLSTELYTYGKEDIKRLKKGRNDNRKKKDDIPEDIKELLD